MKYCLFLPLMSFGVNMAYSPRFMQMLKLINYTYNANKKLCLSEKEVRSHVIPLLHENPDGMMFFFKNFSSRIFIKVGDELLPAMDWYNLHYAH